MGINSKSIRDLNKVEIFFLKEEDSKFIVDGSENNKVFFYTTQGWDFNFAIDTSSTIFAGAKNLINNPMLSALATEMTGGISTVIDMERKYVFSGSKPLEFTINGFRILENGPEEDIYKPVNTLLEWLLPERANETATTAITKEIDDRIASSAAAGKDTAGWEFIQKGIKAIESFTGKVYFLRVPKQFSMDGGYKMAIKIGGQTIRNVFLKSVSIKTPKFHYAKEDGATITPIPDRVDVVMTFETLRTAVKKDYDFKL